MRLVGMAPCPLSLNPPLPWRRYTLDCWSEEIAQRFVNLLKVASAFGMHENAPPAASGTGNNIRLRAVGTTYSGVFTQRTVLLWIGLYGAYTGVGFSRVPIDAFLIISENILSGQSLALVLCTV